MPSFLIFFANNTVVINKVTKFINIIPSADIILNTDKISIFKIIRPNVIGKKYKPHPNIMQNRHDAKNISKQDISIG